MTPQSSIDYDTLPACPETNALVAERVMGWLDVGMRQDGGSIEFVNFGVDPATVEERHAKKYSVRQVVPDYSTDIAAAFQVVSKLREQNWLVTIKVMPARMSFTIEGSHSEYDVPSADRFVGQGKVLCELTWMGDGLRHPELVFEDSVPLAIVRARLKAVSV